MTDDMTPNEYHAEMQRLRGELHEARGLTVVPDEKPRRISLSEIVRLMLTKTGRERSGVTIARNAKGEVQYEVAVEVGDHGAESVEEAERIATVIFDSLAARYPLTEADHDNASVSLTRNAKGDTQMVVEMKTSGGTGRASIAEVGKAVEKEYDRQRARYPMADGRTARPGSVA